MKDLVRDPVTGEPILCAWDDCGQWGDDREKAVVTEGKGSQKKQVHYIFCSTGHKSYWLNSTASYGNKLPGDRSGLILPGRK